MSPRPITILGAGVLGRRIAAVFLAGGHRVHIRDPSPEALSAATAYIDAHIGDFTAIAPSHPTPGTYETFTDLQSSVKEAWLVIEAVPEILPLKIRTFGELDRYTPGDCILASNSSSFKSGLMVGDVGVERRKRVLNVHFTMPPGIRTVEMMTCGVTGEEVFERLKGVLGGCGMVVAVARRESTGFIFNRLWAAIKREILQILAGDVSSPEEIDLLWENMFHCPSSLPPCRLMDQIGLDTVAFIENNYIQERGLDGHNTVDWLRERYIKDGRLGVKSQGGGLYPPISSSGESTSAQAEKVYLLDVGLGANTKNISMVPTAGRILLLDPLTGQTETIVKNQSLPDGIDISRSTGRIFWTNMGSSTRTNDGSVHSANLDGSDIQTLLPPGRVHTPKQLVVDDDSQRIYFCDREGMSVHRVNFDGSGHEILIRTGSIDIPHEKSDMTRWCVGVSLDARRGYIYWTQKGASKSGQGRIFRAGIDIPAGESAEKRTDIELLLGELPEPIDLEVDVEGQVLYWTDRGEHPVGCSLNRVDIGGGEVGKKEILARHFHEPIGVRLGREGRVYVADLGGSVYCVEDGEKVVVRRDEGCYTGVAVLG